MGFVIVIRKNLSMRLWEINMYRTLGFADKRIEQLFYKENLLVPLYALATGVISALVGGKQHLYECRNLDMAVSLAFYHFLCSVRTGFCKEIGKG